jgi:hypothetical protein
MLNNLIGLFTIISPGGGIQLIPHSFHFHVIGWDWGNSLHIISDVIDTSRSPYELSFSLAHGHQWWIHKIKSINFSRRKWEDIIPTSQ